MATKAVALTSSAAAGSVAAPSPSGGGQRTQLERATLKLYEPPEKAKGGPPTTATGTIPFQFNPKEVTISKSASWRRNQVKDADTAGPVEFAGAEPCKLTLEMFFDATGKHDGSVVAAVESLLRCCTPTQTSRDKKKPAPVVVVFQWGKITSFPAFVAAVGARYTLFATDGTPIRATCSVSLEELPVEAQKTNPTSGALSVRRVHTVVDGDSLASVAHREYGDAQLWRPLAAFNGIDDPMVLPRGRSLLVPAIEDLLAPGWDR